MPNPNPNPDPNPNPNPNPSPNSNQVDMSVVSLNDTINSKLYESGVFDIDTSNINDATSEGSTASAKLATMAADVSGLCNCNCNSDLPPAHPLCVLYTSVSNNLASIRTHLDAAISNIDATTSTLDTLLVQLDAVRLQIPLLLSAVESINGALSCAW